MLFGAFSLFFKKLFGFDITAVFIVIMLAMVAAIVIPNYSKVLGFFGYESREVLKEQRDAAVQNTQVVIDANKESVKVVDTLKETTKNIESVIIDVVKKEKTIHKQYTEVKEKKDTKIQDIKDSKEKSVELQEKEISEVQINSLWDSYCGFNTSELCKPVVSGT